MQILLCFLILLKKLPSIWVLIFINNEPRIKVVDSHEVGVFGEDLRNWSVGNEFLHTETSAGKSKIYCSKSNLPK
jgi:hypothetical protein